MTAPARLRAAAAALAFVGLLATDHARADSGRRFRCGDVSGDGVQDIADVVLTLRAATGLVTLEYEDRETADLAPVEELETWRGVRVIRNPGNMIVDIGDAVAALRLAVGLDRLNNCAPMPVVTGCNPGWHGTCADGHAIASVTGNGLAIDVGLPSIGVNGVPATVLRTATTDGVDTAWFVMPDLELHDYFGYVTIRVETPEGIAISADRLRANEDCVDWMWSAYLTPSEGERQKDHVVTISGNNAACVRAARLVGHDSGREVELLDLDPRDAGSLRARIPAFPEADGESYDLVVETACGSVVEGASWRWYRPEAPDVTSVVPEVGPVEGGIEVRLTGTGLDQVTEIYVGTQRVPGGDYNIVSPQMIVISALPPAATAAATTVAAIVTRNRGYVDPSPMPFTYVGAGEPRCDSFQPTEGPWTGGTPVTIHGTGLSSVNFVMFDYSTAYGLERPDPSSLRVRTRAMNQSGTTAEVHLSWGDGSVVTCPGVFTFVP